jgi:hypothetical protein
MSQLFYLALGAFSFVNWTSIVSAKQCSTGEDCRLNGVCIGTQCVCDTGWKGSNCGELDLRPADRNSGYNRTAEGISSWGSKIIHDPKEPNLFHLFLAEFTDGCGLDYWSPYSRIIRAESISGPAGPYVFATEVVGTFSHNPTVVFSKSDNEYLLYYIGCPYEPNMATCTPPQFSCGPGNFLNGESGISLQSSPDLIEWSPVGQIFSGANSNAWDADVTNPSPLPLYSPENKTSEILLVYRGCPYNCSGNELINIATASDVEGSYTRKQADPIFMASNEDPFVWKDKRGHFHMLLHSLELEGGFGDGPKVGRHAFARAWDGAWTFDNETLAFNTTVQYTQGPEVDFFRRERPQLFFSEDGEMTPLFLTTGVQERNSPMSYSVIQPIGDGAAGYEKNQL